MALLTTRYGQTHKIFHAHIQTLAELASPTNSHQLFYDTVESHIRGLRALGTKVESYGLMLIPTIQSKLPRDIHTNVARGHGNNPWTITQLKDAILKEIEVLDTVMSPLNKSSHEAHTAPMTAALHTNASSHHSQRSKNNCLFCKGSHLSTRCDKVTDPQQRLEIVKKGKHCFNCLGHHRVPQCTSKFCCKSCKQKHHSSFCGAEFSKPQDVTTKPDTTTQSVSKPKSALATTNKPDSCYCCYHSTRLCNQTC